MSISVSNKCMIVIWPKNPMWDRHTSKSNHLFFPLPFLCGIPMPLIAEYIKCTNNVKDNLVPHKRITLCNLSKKLLLCIHTMQPRQETFVLHHDHTMHPIIFSFGNLGQKMNQEKIGTLVQNFYVKQILFSTLSLISVGNMKLSNIYQ